MQKKILILMLILVGCQIYSQKENNIWVLENGNVIDFSSGKPTVSHEAKTNFVDGNATVSNSHGDLLFYTSGETIWNKNHQIMANGDNIFGGFSSRQGANILQLYEDKNKYLVVYQGAGYMKYKTDIHYSIIDFTNNPLGEVSKKNIFLRDNMAEGSIIVQKECGQYWLVGHERDSDIFLSFLIQGDSIGQEPVITKIGSDISTINGGHQSILRYNNSTNTIAIEYGRKVALLKINLSTGQFHDYIDLCSNNIEAAEFSQSGQKLYKIEQHGVGITDIFQYDLSEWDSDRIKKSKLYIGTTKGIWSVPFASARIGPDGQIYIMRIGMDHMAVIKNPEAEANDVILEENGLYLGDAMDTDPLDFYLTVSNLGTPSLIPDRLETIQNKTYDICTQSIFIPEDDISAYDVSYLWSTGETSASIQIDSAGTYVLQRTKGVCTSIDTFKVTKSTQPSIPYPPDTTLCLGEKLELDLSPFVGAIQWSDGSDQTRRTITESGSYEGTINPNSDCESQFAIQVAFLSTPTVDLGEDMTVCGLNVIEIGTDLGPDVNYNWNTGETTPIIVISEDDQYWVEVQKNGCSSRDSINIKFAESGGLNGHHAEFHHICPDSILELSIREQNAMNIVWNTGEAGRSITIESPGQYIASYTQNECPATFTYDIFSSSNEVQLDSLVELCQAQSTALSIIGLENNQRFEWNTGATTDEIEVDAPGNYTVITTNQDGCKRTDRINVTSQPVTVIHPFKDTSICQGTSLTLEIDDALWLWNDTLFAKSLTVTTSQLVSAVNPINCTITNPIFVSVDRCIVNDTCDIYLPNAVSASVTHVVDHSYTAFTTCPLEQYTMYVFDRWGNQVYISHAIDNGLEVEDYPLGVYVAKFEYRFSGDIRDRLKYGTFTVF